MLVDSLRRHTPQSPAVASALNFPSRAANDFLLHPTLSHQPVAPVLKYGWFCPPVPHRHLKSPHDFVAVIIMPPIVHEDLELSHHLRQTTVNVARRSAELTPAPADETLPVFPCAALLIKCGKFPGCFFAYSPVTTWAAFDYWYQ